MGWVCLEPAAGPRAVAGPAARACSEPLARVCSASAHAEQARAHRELSGWLRWWGMASGLQVKLAGSGVAAARRSCARACARCGWPPGAVHTDQNRPCRSHQTHDDPEHGRTLISSCSTAASGQSRQCSAPERHTHPQRNRPAAPPPTPPGPRMQQQAPGTRARILASLCGRVSDFRAHSSSELPLGALRTLAQGLRRRISFEKYGKI